MVLVLISIKILSLLLDGLFLLLFLLLLQPPAHKVNATIFRNVLRLASPVNVLIYDAFKQFTVTFYVNQRNPHILVTLMPTHLLLHSFLNVANLTDLDHLVAVDASHSLFDLLEHGIVFGTTTPSLAISSAILSLHVSAFSYCLDHLECTLKLPFIMS